MFCRILCIVMTLAVSLIAVVVWEESPRIKQEAIWESPAIASVAFTNCASNGPKIRLVILKHCREQMADDDAEMAISAARKAAAKGLSIKTIGNQLIDRNGKARVALYDFDWDDLPKVRSFTSEQLKMEAESDDTVIIFTIGHGGQDGGLMTLGQREGVMKAFASAAEDCDQKVLWWQLSCHASMRLPAISALPARQQELFGIVASSGTEPSPARVEGKIMEKVFVAMAENSKDIDPNGDCIITRDELSGFFRSINDRRADRVFAKSGDFAIFGGAGDLANQIPIVDRNGPQSKYPKGYIPRPIGR
jgi:hypothetical protein